jgi:hypothetical protein
METLYILIGIIIFFSLFRDLYNQDINKNYKLLGITLILIYAYVFTLTAYNMQTLENYFKIILSIIFIGLFIE